MAVGGHYCAGIYETLTNEISDGYPDWLSNRLSNIWINVEVALLNWFRPVMRS